MIQFHPNPIEVMQVSQVQPPSLNFSDPILDHLPLEPESCPVQFVAAEGHFLQGMLCKQIVISCITGLQGPTAGICLAGASTRLIFFQYPSVIKLRYKRINNQIELISHQYAVSFLQFTLQEVTVCVCALTHLPPPRYEGCLLLQIQHRHPQGIGWYTMICFSAEKVYLAKYCQSRSAWLQLISSAAQGKHICSTCHFLSVSYIWLNF